MAPARDHSTTIAALEKGDDDRRWAALPSWAQEKALTENRWTERGLGLPSFFRSLVERATGIEPAWPAWKAGALPLSYARGTATSRSPQPAGSLPALRWIYANAWPGTIGSGDAAGRSVVASAPALGAGDREFESPRPDCLLSFQRTITQK